MASDSQDSHRKHHRSVSDDDSPENSKRHKHRHHRHHHRRHRHHRSKHGDDKKDEVEVANKTEVKIVPKHDDYDMEEGEIVEEDGVSVVEAPVNDNKIVSDIESGELDDSYTREDASMDYDSKSSKILKPKSDRSDDSKNHRNDESPMSASIVNGDGRKKSRSDSRSHGRKKSPSSGSSKHWDKHRIESKERCVELMEVDEDEREARRNSHSRKDKDIRHRGAYPSPSGGRFSSETGNRNRSDSPDWLKDERSQSNVPEGHTRMRHRHGRDELIFENGKVDDDLDAEKDIHRHTDYKLDSDQRGRDKRRDRSSSRHRSSKHEHGDFQDREREEMVYRNKNRMREQDPIRGRNHRVLEYELDRRGRGSEMEMDSDREYEKTREVERDTDWDKDYRREKVRGHSRDRDHEIGRRRDASISSYRDRDLERGRIRDKKSDADREGDKYRGRGRRDDEFDRSRRYHRYDDHGTGQDTRNIRHGYDDEYHRVRDKKYESDKDWVSKVDAVIETEDEVNSADDGQKQYLERVELKLAEREDDDVNRIKEESRRRREAILQKYKVKQLHQQESSSDAKESGEELNNQSSQNVASANNVQLESNDGERGSEDTSEVNGSFNFRTSPYSNQNTVAETTTNGGLGEGSPKCERLNDMFCDDIFGDSPAGTRKTGKGDGLPVERSGLHDNWDDPEGYYSFRFGEILDNRYEIAAAHGKGVFSIVVRAKDLKAGSNDPEEVAIKIIRNNETMLKAGTEELVILKKLVGADPDDRRHCVRYLSNFMYRNHLCVVFESLHMNLREVLKKFGRNIGLKLTAVRAYAKQLFIALKHLRNCGVLHCDIKPDNMLVNDAKNVLKLCDFGNAMFAGKNEITPYLVSRFYRAPEIILGLPYDHPMDIWSVGCCLYELYTGKVLFPGATNNDMLRLHMELKGPFPKKMLRKGAFIEQHFDQDLNFLATEEDPVTKKAIRRLIINIKPKDIGTIVKGSAGEDPKMLTNFKDLLDKIFVLDPDKRLTVSQALNHPFITGK